MRRPGTASGLWWSGAAALVLVALVPVMWHVDDVVVLGDVVPRRSAVMAALLATGVALVTASALLRRAAPAPQRRLRRWTSAVTTCLVLGAAVLCFAGALLLDATSNWVVLRPSSTGGCRVVVEERSFLLLGSGVVHVLPAGGFRPRPVATYGADDGYRPVTRGTWSLRWHGETARLELRGTEHQPVVDGSVRVACADRSATRSPRWSAAS